MKVFTAEPFLSEIIKSFGAAESLVVPAVEEGSEPKFDFREAILKGGRSRFEILQSGFFSHSAVRTLVQEQPEQIFIWIHDRIVEVDKLNEEINELCNSTVKIHLFSPRSLDDIYKMYQTIGKVLGVPAKGRELSSRVKAQLLDWCDSFYTRMRNKKVTFISAINPFHLGGYWIPDLIRAAGARSQFATSGHLPKKVTWEDIVKYEPDVIVVSPSGMALSESLRFFKHLETLPQWESIPAVKRSEVVFTDGDRHFHRPGLEILSSMSILVSAIAGLDSGYISERDSFQRLRWLELQRHRI